MSKREIFQLPPAVLHPVELYPIFLMRFRLKLTTLGRHIFLYSNILKHPFLSPTEHNWTMITELNLIGISFYSTLNLSFFPFTGSKSPLRKHGIGARNGSKIFLASTVEPNVTRKSLRKIGCNQITTPLGRKYYRDCIITATPPILRSLMCSQFIHTQLSQPRRL